MFNVKHNECVGFESRWRVKKYLSNPIFQAAHKNGCRVSSVGATQTTDYSTADMESSTSTKVDIEVQTESQQQSSNVEVDEEKLAAWLKRIYPSVKKELDDIANSKAFRGYKLSTDTSDANCKLVQTVDVTPHVKDSEIGSQISALSWNSTNKTLAVSCTYKHSSWCYHEGFVAFYTLDKDDNLSPNPRTKLSTESCVTCVEFHTVLPAVVAAGLFSGAIIIWNMQKEEEEIVAKVDGHGDSITQLSWIIDINSTKNVLLASSSLDGLLTLWNFNCAESYLIVKEKHQIKSPLFPKNAPTASEEVMKKVARGINCFDFSKHTPEMFVVGAEGGMVVQCSLLGCRKLPGSTAEAPLLDPAFKYYEAHKAEVTTIKFSPNRSDMFMSSGSDSEIRIYMIGQEDPAQIIFVKNSLNCVTWVPYEEKIISGCGKSGFIEIFQIVKGKSIENTTKDKVQSDVMTQIHINRAKTNIVAVGTENGHIQMWRVPWALFGNLSV